MARTYRRDARGRFVSSGYSGQTGGRGARLASGGRQRSTGGSKANAPAVKGVVSATPRGRAASGKRRQKAIAKAERFLVSRAYSGGITLSRKADPSSIRPQDMAGRAKAERGLRGLRRKTNEVAARWKRLTGNSEVTPEIARLSRF